MKYLIIGIILILTGIGLGIWHLYEPIPEPPPFMYLTCGVRMEKLLAPYLVTFGMIITFAGIVSVRYTKCKKKCS